MWSRINIMYSSGGRAIQKFQPISYVLISITTGCEAYLWYLFKYAPPSTNYQKQGILAKYRFEIRLVPRSKNPLLLILSSARSLLIPLMIWWKYWKYRGEGRAMMIFPATFGGHEDRSPSLFPFFDRPPLLRTISQEPCSMSKVRGFWFWGPKHRQVGFSVFSTYFA